MTEALARGENYQSTWTNKFVYYLGPTPAKPGDPIGSAGPTTSGRMELTHQQCLTKVSKA